MINIKDPNPKEQFFSLFPFGELNQSAVIAKDDDVLIKDSNGNIVLRGNAEMCLDVIPEYGIHAHFTRTNSSIDFSKIFKQFESLEPFNVEFKNYNMQFKGILTENNRWYSFVFSPALQPIIGLGDDKTQMQHVVFHLFNFRYTFSKITSFEQMEIPSYPIEPVHVQHIHLKDDKWVVNLRSFVSSAPKQKFNRYEMTHVCYLEKADQTSFLGTEAFEILAALRYFFSFAKGDWCNPVCAVGFDSYGSRVWEHWLSPEISCHGQSNEISWFDNHHPEQLEELFPRFMSFWSDKEYKDALMEVMYWYFIANNANIDTGIILAHTALERLSYQYCKAKSKKGCIDYKLEKFFEDLNIPDVIIDDIPDLKNLLPNLKDLFKEVNDGIKAKNFKNLRTKNSKIWTGAPTALSEIRNYIVHPEHKYYPADFSTAIWDANKLGLWYLELSLLNLFKYPGKYYNRLEMSPVGKVYDIPRKK